MEESCGLAGNLRRKRVRVYSVSIGHRKPLKQGLPEEVLNIEDRPGV